MPKIHFIAATDDPFEKLINAWFDIIGKQEKLDVTVKKYKTASDKSEREYHWLTIEPDNQNQQDEILRWAESLPTKDLKWSFRPEPKEGDWHEPV